MQMLDEKDKYTGEEIKEKAISIFEEYIKEGCLWQLEA